MQTIPLRQIWPEDLVFAIILDAHIQYVQVSVQERRLLDCIDGKCSDTDKLRKKSLSDTS